MSNNRVPTERICISTKLQLASAAIYLRAAETLQRRHYVDDYLDSFDSEEKRVKWPNKGRWCIRRVVSERGY